MNMTKEFQRANTLHPELVEALKKRPAPKFPKDASSRQARADHLARLRHLMPVPGPIPELVTETEHLVPAQDGYQIKVMSYRPVKEQPPGPLVVLFHEGGWRKGDLTDEEFNARLLTRDLGVTCLNVEYRLAPEHKFPTSVTDSWEVVRWAAANSSTVHANPSKGFIVGGSSAGGNISAVIAHLSRNTHLHPPITGQWLSVSFLIPSSKVPAKYADQYVSMSVSESCPIIAPFNDADPNGIIIKPLRCDLDSPLFSVVSPELYPPTKENQAGKGPLAKAYFQVAGLDPLRDHSLVYEQILRKEYGVNTRLDLYEGFGHMFWTNWPEMETSKRFARDMVAGFRWLLA